MGVNIDGGLLSSTTSIFGLSSLLFFSFYLKLQSASSSSSSSRKKRNDVFALFGGRGAQMDWLPLLFHFFILGLTWGSYIGRIDIIIKIWRRGGG